MFDDDYRVAAVREPVENFDEFLHVVHVQSRGGLVEDIESFAGIALAEFGGELDALRFASRKRRRRLSEPYISQSHVLQALDLVVDTRNVAEKLASCIHRHVEHVENGFAFELDF